MQAAVKVNGRFRVHRVTGMQRYAIEITRRLGARVEVIAPRGRAQGIRGHLWEQGVLGSRLRGSLLWSPCQTGPLGVGRQVVTIHDCAFVDQPHCFSRAFAAWYQWLVPRLARRVRRIITISRFSRDRIADHCRVPVEKIDTIYSGVDPRFRPHTPEEIDAVKRRLSLPERYVLCVGSLEPRKNLRRLLEAWSLLPHQQLGLSLVLAGAKGHVFGDAGLPAPPPAVHLPGYLDDETLPAVYAGAEAFVFPSIYEGFGLPLLEAMASGTPVVCSNNTALPEVAGAAAVFVDAYDIESIAQGIRTLCEDESLRSRLRDAGLARAKDFTWERTTEATWQSLQAAI